MITGLNWLDLAFLGIIAVSALLGIIKGLIRELFSLAFFILAVIFAFLFFRDLGVLVQKTIHNRDIANIVAFIAIFAGVILLGSVVTFLVRKLFSIGSLKTLDRVTGGFFGLVRGILISGVIVFALVVFPVNEKIVMQSRLSPFLFKTINWVIKVIPGSYKNRINYYFNKKNGQKNSGTGRSI